MVSVRGAAVLRNRKAARAAVTPIRTIEPIDTTRPLPKKLFSRVQARSRRILGEVMAVSGLSLVRLILPLRVDHLSVGLPVQRLSRLILSGIGSVMALAFRSVEVTHAFRTQARPFPIGLRPAVLF
jgi:hypothetical protein